MGSVSTQNTHPLTVSVAGGEQRDVVGHLVIDRRGDREFRFVKIRGGHTVSQGMALTAWRLSAISSDPYNVTCDAAASVSSKKRDFVGIAVTQSIAASGDHCWMMTKGRLGKINGSLYPDTAWALVSAAAAVVAGMTLGVSQSGTGSATRLVRLVSAWDFTSAGAGGSAIAQGIGQALSTDTGDKLTRGVIRSSLLHGGGFGVGVI